MAKIPQDLIRKPNRLSGFSGDIIELLFGGDLVDPSDLINPMVSVPVRAAFKLRKMTPQVKRLLSDVPKKLLELRDTDRMLLKSQGIDPDLVVITETGLENPKTVEEAFTGVQHELDLIQEMFGDLDINNPKDAENLQLIINKLRHIRGPERLQ